MDRREREIEYFGPVTGGVGRVGGRGSDVPGVGDDDSLGGLSDRMFCVQECGALSSTHRERTQIWRESGPDQTV